MTRPENGNALLRLAGRKAKGSLASCIPSRIALNHSHAMRTQKTPDWKRQKTGLRAGPANGCELVDAARSGSTQIWRNDSAFLLRINPLPLHNFQTAGIVVADSY